MRLIALAFLSILSPLAMNAADPKPSWTDLSNKRAALTAFHQDFEVSRTYKMEGHTQASKSSLSIDSAGERCRQHSVSGAGDHIAIFDGQNLYELEEGSNEYLSPKRPRKGEVPQPGPYASTNLDFSKVVEMGNGPCGLSHLQHECLTLKIPVKPRLQSASGKTSRRLGGVGLFVFDTTTGLLISSRIVEDVESEHGVYRSDITYALADLRYNGPVDESLFTLPAGADEVKEFQPWNANRIKKQLAGKMAPDLAVTDLQGRPINVRDLKGKTVLLDFWTTWCGPCREDAPALDKLYDKYGDKNLAIIGVSVNEDRIVVKKFLNEHPHQFPIVLTTENEMPRAYQIGTFPTYVVIDSEGNVASAAEGNKGLAELTKLLKKAGLGSE